MKRLFLMLLSGLFLTFIYGQTQAQTEKGNWLLGGSGSFQHLSRGSNVKSNRIQLYPKGGLLVTDHLAVGLMPSVDLSIMGKGNRTIATPSTYSLSIGPFVRYYYPVSPSISLFAEGYATYGTDFQKPKNHFSSNILYNWRIGPGVAFFLSRSASLDISVGYGQKNSVSNVTGEKRTTKINMTDLQFGFSIYLPGKKK